MPTTSSKVPAAVAEVEERKAYWLKKRAEAKETGVVTEEREEAGPSKPPKANGVARGRGGNGNTLDLTAELWPGVKFPLVSHLPPTGVAGKVLAKSGQRIFF